MDLRTSRAKSKTDAQRTTKAIEKGNCAHFGCHGSLFIDDTAQHTGPFYAIQGVLSAVLDVSDMTHDIEDAADFTIPDGATIYGDFKVASLASGTCLAYKKEN